MLVAPAGTRVSSPKPVPTMVCPSTHVALTPLSVWALPGLVQVEGGPVGAAPSWKVVSRAASYGPTKGPPLPEGAAPAGWMDPAESPVRARARLRRPLPVPSAGSAL